MVTKNMTEEEYHDRIKEVYDNFADANGMVDETTGYSFSNACF